MSRKLLGLYIGAFCLIGCTDNSPPPPRAEVPPPEMRNTPPRTSEPVKPLPEPDRESQVVAPPFDDVPLMNQPVPEAQAFVEAYNRVGRPRMTVFMNRTLEGKTIPVNPNGINLPPDANRNSNGQQSGNTADTYLPPGEYDEAYAKSLDYEAMENTTADWISCNSQVTLVAPMMARQKLTDQQVKDLNSGRPQVLREIAQQLDVDILIHIQAHPTQQSSNGLKVRIVAEAINTKGGESLARAFVDTTLPLEKQTINKYTRFLSRKLMDGMIGAWYATPKENVQNQPVPPAPPPPQMTPPVAPPQPAPQAPPPQVVPPVIPPPVHEMPSTAPATQP